MTELASREITKGDTARRAPPPILSNSTDFDRIGRRLPLRVEAFKKSLHSWFYEGSETGIVIVDARAHNWQIIWSNSSWHRVTEIEPALYASLWSFFTKSNAEITINELRYPYGQKREEEELQHFIMESLAHGNPNVTVGLKIHSNIRVSCTFSEANKRGDLPNRINDACVRPLETSSPKSSSCYLMVRAFSRGYGFC